jgi:tRNA A-37 threonylcarbamoyl transferase component Bud32
MQIDRTLLQKHVEQTVATLLRTPDRLGAAPATALPRGVRKVDLDACRQLLEPLVSLAMTRRISRELKGVVAAAPVPLADLPRECLRARVDAPTPPLLRYLARGGYGHVFILDAHRVAKFVDIKAYDPRSLAAFRNEVDLMSRAAKTGVGPRLLDAFYCTNHEEGYMAGVIVQERIQGITLYSWLQQVRSKYPVHMSEKLVREMGDKVQGAIARLHRASIFHNDLHHLLNIMVEQQTSEPRIIDYGFATRNPDALPLPLRDRVHTDLQVLGKMGITENATLIRSQPHALIVQLAAAAARALIVQGVISFS